MDAAGRISLTIAVGIVVSLLYSRRTGWSSGGLVSAGLLAVQASDPLRFAAVLLLATALSAVLRFLTKTLSLYGRERVGAALLLVLALRFALRGFVLWGQTGIDAFWIGWIAPGLIAADIERQGLTMTLAAAVSTSLTTAFAANLIAGCVNILS
ncbi:MAG: poly-gamma-glutamate biosynthesis protein PgsC/CapC [Synergistaceae bacterium]|jgi:poly-gamma-glutamate biosynthesis protein PgsC/CapC|nr:poly-gamma-glutamate biosynthesis protein PgsC/CapC [Synergistaceae bacterium]